MVNPYKYVVREDTGKNDVEHRVIMEAHLGRKLTTEELVHHIDHNPKNNDILNLQLTDIRSHGRHHVKPKSIILIRCTCCGKLVQKIRSNHMFKLKSGITKFYCNRSCRSKGVTPPYIRPKRMYGENKDLTLSELVKRECGFGKTASDIIKEFGIDKATVYYAMKINNIPRGISTHKLYPDLQKSIREDLSNKMRPIDIIDKYPHISESTIYRNLSDIKKNK